MITYEYIHERKLPEARASSSEVTEGKVPSIKTGLGMIPLSNSQIGKPQNSPRIIKELGMVFLSKKKKKGGPRLNDSLIPPSKCEKQNLEEYYAQVPYICPKINLNILKNTI